METKVELKYPVGTWLYSFDVIVAKSGDEIFQKAVPWENPMQVKRWNVGFTGADHPLIVRYELSDVPYWAPDRIRECYEEYLFDTKEACQDYCDKGNALKSWGTWRS